MFPFNRLSARRALRRAICVSVLAFGLAASTRAADDNTVIVPGASRAEGPAKAGGGSFNSLSLMLGLALAGVGGWMVWRNRRGVPVARDMRALAIDETRSLGNKQYLVVASYEGKKFLIGVCPGRIDMLSPLDANLARERARE